VAKQVVFLIAFLLFSVAGAVQAFRRGVAWGMLFLVIWAAVFHFARRRYRAK